MLISEHTAQQSLARARSVNWIAEMIRQAAIVLKNMLGALLSMLHAIHNQRGFLVKAAAPVIARALQQIRIEVRSEVSQYAKSPE